MENKSAIETKTRKEDIPSSQKSPPYFLRSRAMKEAQLVLELVEKLQQAQQKVEEQIAEEHQLRTEVCQMVPRVMKKYLDDRYDRLINAKLEFAQPTNNLGSEELKKVEERLHQLELEAAKEAEERKKELEEAQRVESELKQRVDRKSAILKALN